MFEHPDATTAWPTIDVSEGLQNVLVIETKLCLWPLHKEYSEGKVSALIAAAEEFKAKNGFDRIRLISIRES